MSIGVRFLLNLTIDLAHIHKGRAQALDRSGQRCKNATLSTRDLTQNISQHCGSMKQAASRTAAHCLLGRKLMKNARLFVSLCATAALASFAGCSTTDDSTISVDNQSQSNIQDIRIAGTGDTNFGPNLLGSDLAPGDTLTISVVCDTYDIQLTDETDTTCVLQGVDVCGSDATWVITEADLNDCANGFFKSAHPHGLQVSTKSTAK
jgi:hypothetical protein